MKNNKVLQCEAIIPEYLICYLINGDIGDLSSQDIAEVQLFESSLTKEYKVSSLIYSVKDSNEDPFFSTVNSINTMGCNCYTVIISLFLSN